MAFIGVCVVFIAIVLLILSIPEEKKKKSLEFGIAYRLNTGEQYNFGLALNLIFFIVSFLIEFHTVQLNSQIKI